MTTAARATRTPDPVLPVKPWPRTGLPRVTPAQEAMIVGIARPTGKPGGNPNAIRTVAALLVRGLAVRTGDHQVKLTSLGQEVADQILAERDYAQFWQARREGVTTRDIEVHGAGAREHEVVARGTTVRVGGPAGEASILVHTPSGRVVGTEYGAVQFQADVVAAAEALSTPALEAPAVAAAQAVDRLFAQGRRFGAPGSDGTEGEAAIRPRRGMRFVHAHRLVKVDGVPVREWPHEVYEVTRVDEHAVFYRVPGTRQAGWRLAPERFPTAVLEVLAVRPAEQEQTSVARLVGGDVFSVDTGLTWHTFAWAEPGWVHVYADERRGRLAPTRRLNLEGVEPVLRGVRGKAGRS